ncbi:MAG TPA: universal stress protein [Syntrophorhabdales bacterium]|nr:universal stress protein [Syntrophorhabdales bacterium]
MVTYKNILFCTDFSKSAQAALPYAIDLAKKYGAALHLLHVYQDAGHIAEFELSSDTKSDYIRVAHLMGTEMEKRLETLCEEIVKELGSCEHKMVRGKAHIEIIRYTKEKNVDLIVMASHGLSGLEHVLFGSTAERVLRESPCNVFVIKRPAG